MIDPLAALRSEIGDMEKRVLVAVQVAILREGTSFTLARLMLLDPDHAASYREAMHLVGDADD